MRSSPYLQGPGLLQPGDAVLPGPVQFGLGILQLVQGLLDLRLGPRTGPDQIGPDQTQTEVPHGGDALGAGVDLRLGDGDI